MRHIVHILTRLRHAGSEENTLITAAHQRKCGHRITTIHGPDSEQAVIDKFAALGDVYEVPDLIRAMHPIADMRAIGEITHKLRKLRPDVVHTHQSKGGVVGRAAAKLAGVPTIIHGVHILAYVGEKPLKKAVYVMAERAVAPLTHAFIDVSRGMQEQCIAHRVGTLDNHFIAHSGMDLSRFFDASPPEDWREILKIGPNDDKPVTFVMLAALEPRKRHKEFLTAFAKAATKTPDIRAVFGGDGEERARLEALADELGIGDKVSFLGYYPAPERLIALSDATVLTSAREGLPRVVMQSIAGGRPVIVTDLAGIDEIIDDGKNGVIIPTDDWDGLANELIAFATDNSKRAALQAAAASTSVTKWSIESMTARIDEAYDKAMARTKPFRPRAQATSA